ncbi:MAG: sigma-54-dependent Fis family transcriptional regulator, partial [Nitrospirae bacterium]
YRLNVIEIVIPPLRERKEDIPLLVEHFIRKFSRENNKDIQGISEEAMEAILNYSWPGNVRELANTIERAVVLSRGPLITLNELPEKVRVGVQSQGGSLKDTLNYYEKKIILDRLIQFNWHKEQVAKSLGIDLATLYRKMKKLGIKDRD